MSFSIEKARQEVKLVNVSPLHSQETQSPTFSILPSVPLGERGTGRGLMPPVSSLFSSTHSPSLALKEATLSTSLRSSGGGRDEMTPARIEKEAFCCTAPQNRIPMTCTRAPLQHKPHSHRPEGLAFDYTRWLCNTDSFILKASNEIIVSFYRRINTQAIRT